MIPRRRPDGTVDVDHLRAQGLTARDVEQVLMLDRWLALDLDEPGTPIDRWTASRIPPDLWAWAFPGVRPVDAVEACEGMGT